jgi:hypothetical protein
MPRRVANIFVFPASVILALVTFSALSFAEMVTPQQGTATFSETCCDGLLNSLDQAVDADLTDLTSDDTSSAWAIISVDDGTTASQIAVWETPTNTGLNILNFNATEFSQSTPHVLTAFANGRGFFGSSSGEPENFSRAYFDLAIRPAGFGKGSLLGGNFFVALGTTGSFDFNAQNSANFNGIVAQLTDGIDDFLEAYFHLRTAEGRGHGAGTGGPESKVLGGLLQGRSVDFIRLRIEDSNLSPRDSGWRYNPQFTWEIWGTGEPLEPPPPSPNPKSMP